jgi:ATP-dependent DNA helicase RecG
MKNSATLTQLIKQGENSAVEFKSADVHRDSIAKELVAFANTQGGIILLGVEDNGSISGIPTTEKNYEEWLTNIARENVIPALDVHLEKINYQQKELLKVTVPKGKDKPYQTNKHHFLIRIGSTNRIATQPELMRLFQQSGVFHYDRIGVDNTSIRELNLSKIDQYFDNYQIDFLAEHHKEQILTNTDILDDTQQTTIGGLLLFGIHPQRQLFNACISFAHFAGNTLDEELIDKQVITGTLDIQVDTTLAVLKNNMRQASTIKAGKTINTHFQYPDNVFRELLVNACVHRDYSITGSRIRVFIFDNRIEFISPGRLPNTVSIDKLKMGVSYARNPIIVKFMENMRYIDKLGRGLPMVYNTALKHHKQVQFEEFGEEFRVVLER